MSRVKYECNHCRHYENPMNHANPSARCLGTFVWEGSRVRCNGCNRVYSEGDEFYCTGCKAWRTDYTLS